MRGDYIRGKSDINFLIVTTEKGIQDPEKFFSLMSKWRKKRIAIPVLLTREDICSSLEVYPIEFLSMKRHYRVVFGEDVLAGLAFSVGSVDSNANGNCKERRCFCCSDSSKHKEIRERLGT